LVLVKDKVTQCDDSPHCLSSATNVSYVDFGAI